MLSRHFLRCKVLQALYATQIDGKESVDTPRDFEYHIGRLNELGILQVALLPKMMQMAERVFEEGRKKFRPTQADKQPNLKFLNNIFLTRLSDVFELKKDIERWGGCWETNEDMVREAFIEFRQTKIYGDYLSFPECDFKTDHEFVVNLFRWLMNKETLVGAMQERSLLWEDDFEQIAQYNFMMLKAITEDQLNEAMQWPIMYDKRIEKDEADMEFARMLLRESMALREETDDMIRQRLQGWEFERVALMDKLLINMAVTELIHCPTIPEKVTIDEYIELSKEFSTERSKLFINGLLDKLLLELRKQGRVKKTGRGLLNNMDEDTSL